MDSHRTPFINGNGKPGRFAHIRVKPAPRSFFHRPVTEYFSSAHAPFMNVAPAASLPAERDITVVGRETDCGGLWGPHYERVYVHSIGTGSSVLEGLGVYVSLPLSLSPSLSLSLPLSLSLSLLSLSLICVCVCVCVCVCCVVLCCVARACEREGERVLVFVPGLSFGFCTRLCARACVCVCVCV